MNGCIRLINMSIWPTVIWDRKNKLTSCFLVSIIHVSTVLERLQHVWIQYQEEKKHDYFSRQVKFEEFHLNWSNIWVVYMLYWYMKNTDIHLHLEGAKTE